MDPELQEHPGGERQGQGNPQRSLESLASGPGDALTHQAPLRDVDGDEMTPAMRAAYLLIKVAHGEAEEPPRKGDEPSDVGWMDAADREVLAVQMEVFRGKGRILAGLPAGEGQLFSWMAKTELMSSRRIADVAADEEPTPPAQREMADFIRKSEALLHRLDRDLRDREMQMARWRQLARDDGTPEFVERWDPAGTRFQTVLDVCTEALLQLDACISQNAQALCEEATAEDLVVDLGMHCVRSLPRLRALRERWAGRAVEWDDWMDSARREHGLWVAGRLQRRMRVNEAIDAGGYERARALLEYQLEAFRRTQGLRRDDAAAWRRRHPKWRAGAVRRPVYEWPILGQRTGQVGMVVPAIRTDSGRGWLAEYGGARRRDLGDAAVDPAGAKMKHLAGVVGPGERP